MWLSKPEKFLKKPLLYKFIVLACVVSGTTSCTTQSKSVGVSTDTNLGDNLNMNILERESRT